MSIQQHVRERRFCSKQQHTTRLFSSMDATIVLAPGNPLRGDEGIGQVVLEALKEVDGLPGNIILHDGSRGVLLNLLLHQPRRHMIIVDAGNIGRQPGEWIQCSFKDIRFTQDTSCSKHTLHNAGLIDVFSLAEALGITLPNVTIYCTQPKSLAYSATLSEEVIAAVPEIIGAIMTDLYMKQESDRNHHLAQVADISADDQNINRQWLDLGYVF
jgi:hydrogenase maturation protease